MIYVGGNNYIKIYRPNTIGTYRCGGYSAKVIVEGVEVTRRNSPYNDGRCYIRYTLRVLEGYDNWPEDIHEFPWGFEEGFHGAYGTGTFTPE